MLVDQFKQCPKCEKWFSLEDILGNPNIEVEGMMFKDEYLNENLYFFTHKCEECGSTFTISADKFEDVIGEKIPENINTGSESCEGRCLNKNDVAECKQVCHWAPFRRFLIELVESRCQKPVI